MKRRELRSPRDRVGTLPNADLPPPDEEPPSGEALLRRALVDADAQALDRAVERFRPEMMRVARRWVRSVEDAEDVVQESWVAALSAIRRFEGRASIRTWLLRIVSYRARTLGRRSARSVPMSHLSERDRTDGAETPPAMFAWAPALPDESVLRSELEAHLEACIGTLPPRQGEVLRLRDLEGRPANEVSRRVGVSAENQRVLLHRARKSVRERIGGYLAAGG